MFFFVRELRPNFSPFSTSLPAALIGDYLLGLCAKHKGKALMHVCRQETTMEDHLGCVFLCVPVESAAGFGGGRNLLFDCSNPSGQHSRVPILGGAFFFCLPCIFNFP